MAEALSPTPSMAQKQRATMLSPSTGFFLGSNNDELERAQARAARAAAIRRKSVAATVAAATRPPPPDMCLGKQQILELFQNCIKLASENKINQKNTWELGLIDHLCDIIKVEEEDDVETNFQKASCTLEAGVKIYSMRVDSVHSEAYKVLGGINRVGGQENEEDGTVEDANANSEQDDGHSKKEQERKLSPLSTLESSFEVLNVKKFDVAFVVDPLYHQTSAQFDEGGAKGLLLNNLGVYGGCQVLFDSWEIPGKCVPSATHRNEADMIDLTFAKECIEQMILNVPKANEISPSLTEIVNQFDEGNQRPSDTFSPTQEPAEQLHEADDAGAELDGNSAENCGTWAFDHHDNESVVDEGTYGEDPILPSHEVKESASFEDVDDIFEKVDAYLLLSLGLGSKQNSWAGPDHWKYRKAKGFTDSEDQTKENEPSLPVKKQKNKKQVELDIDFTKARLDGMSNVFDPPKNPKSLLLPANRAPCNTMLPEDCHYQPEDLVKLFLLPNVMCLGRRARKSSDTLNQRRDDYGPIPSWDDESICGGQFDDENAYSDMDDVATLVSQPRQVNKIEVQYDKKSKQVDVQVLKETIWGHIQESNLQLVQEETISFKQMLGTFPNECRAAASLKDISPHLCFICLLHLANEHGLTIHGCANLDDLSINLPTSQRRA